MPTRVRADDTDVSLAVSLLDPAPVEKLATYPKHQSKQKKTFSITPLLIMKADMDEVIGA